MVSTLPSLFQRLTASFACILVHAGAARLARFVPADSLSEREREQLGPRLYAIFCASYGELPSEVVLDEIVFKTGGYLGLYRNRGGELVGFSALAVDRVSSGGREALAIAGSAYFLPGCRGGRAAARLGMVFGLAQKLRHPLRRVVYAFEMLSPVSYRRGAMSFAQIYPHRERRTPDWVEALSRAVIRKRGLLSVPGRPWVVRYEDPASHARPLPAQLSSEDPEVRFYLSQNPRYREGEILVALAPLNAINLLASIVRTFRARGAVNR